MARSHRSIARPYDLARACELLGVPRGRRGSKRDGVTGLRESIEICDRLDAARDVAGSMPPCVPSALPAAGRARGDGPRRRPETGWESLTPTESSVLQLVADGLRNRDIADRLFISRRTVETHLTHVLRKIEVPSRTELVAEASRRRLP